MAMFRKGPRVQVKTVGPSMTKQAFKKDCDINVILEKYRRTGNAEMLRAVQGYYADVSKVPVDYQQALNVVANAHTAFENVPAEIRKVFDNDPGKLLSFVADKKNKEKAQELGLIAKPAPKPPVVPPPSQQDPLDSIKGGKVVEPKA